MTLIENDSPKKHYDGPFIKGQLLPLTFPYINKNDVKMLIDGVPAKLNEDFEIITEVSAEHPVAYPNSAYLKNALPNTKQITLYRVTPLDQQAPFPQNSKFRSERIEQALDKLTMQQQEQRETIARCMKAPITTEEFDGAIPSPDPNKALKINSTGTGFELSEFDPDVAYRDTEIFKNQAQQAASAAEQYKNISVQQAEIATQKAEISVRQADIATRKTEEVVSSGEEALGTLNTRFNEIAAHIEQETAEVTTIAKDWATSEFMVEGIDYSAKYYAEKAKDNSGIYYDELADEDIDVDIISGDYATKSDLELGLDRKQDKGDYATRTELTEGLDTKQETGDYALRSELPNITPLATKTELQTGLNTKQDKGDYATRDELQSGLDTKQAKGNYALKTDLNSLATKSELPTQVSELTNDSNYATQTQVMQAIASIPQFSLSIVEELPLAGEKMVLYLVPREETRYDGTKHDVYDEYIWIEQTASYEHLGSTAPDLTDYVKNTDYPKTANGTNFAGVVKVSASTGINSTTAGYIFPVKATDSEILAKSQEYKVIVPKNLDYAVKTGVTTNTLELTDDEKASARTWLGAVGNTDYANSSTGGVVRVQSGSHGLAVSAWGVLTISKAMDSQITGKSSDHAPIVTKQIDLAVKTGVTTNTIELTDTEKTTACNWLGTSKTQLITEADYNALATKDANTLYLIEE